MMNFWTKKVKKRQKPDKHNLQTAIDIMMEQQRLLAKVWCDGHEQSDLSVLVQKIYDGFLGFKMVSVQPMLAPADVIEFLRFRFNDANEVNLVKETEELVARTRKLCTKTGLDLDETAKSISEEIIREIATDLRNNAGIVYKWLPESKSTIKEYYENLYCKIVEICGVVHRKTLRGGTNWLYMNPKTASIFLTSTSSSGSLPNTSEGVHYLGAVNNRWRLISDSKYPDNEILMGYKGDNNLDSGYFYCPYFLSKIGPDSIQSGHFFNRYGKKLLREGAKFYAKLTIENFKEDE